MEFKNQKELFDYVWETRPNISEIDGSQLYPKGHFMWHWQFGHLLGKGTWKKYKLRPENIILMTVEQHNHQERYPIFIERQNAVRRAYLTEFEGKVFDED
jgi:hypothetical protein